MLPLRSLFLVCLATVVSGQALVGRTHRLEATPQNVVIGYFDAHAGPVVTVASGGIVDGDTLITLTPDALERMGLPGSEVQQSLRDILSAKLEHGPADHILTGPIFVYMMLPKKVLSGFN
jgi:hypothetical protein